MRLKTSFVLAGAVLLLCVPSWARAEKMNMAVSLDVKVHESRATFEPNKDHVGEEWLYLTTANDDVEFNMRMSISGQKDIVQKGRASASEVPGVTEGVSGYKRAKIETFGNELALVIETKLTRKKKKDDKDFEENEDSVERIPLQFKNKTVTMQDFKNGKPVECLITSAGLKNMLGRAKDKNMGSLNLNAKGEGAKVSASGSAKLLNSRRKGTVFISPQRIEYDAPAIHVRAQGRVSINDLGG